MTSRFKYRHAFKRERSVHTSSVKLKIELADNFVGPAFYPSAPKGSLDFLLAGECTVHLCSLSKKGRCMKWTQWSQSFQLNPGPAKDAKDTWNPVNISGCRCRVGTGPQLVSPPHPLLKIATFCSVRCKWFHFLTFSGWWLGPTCKTANTSS